MTAGYWQDPDRTAVAIREGWFYTGDLAYRDADGYYWFFARKSEVIHCRGKLVSPVQVEGVLYQHPAVRQAGVVGIPERGSGEAMRAFVVLGRGDAAVDCQGLLEFARAHLGTEQWPESVTVVDRLPAGPTGKIDRNALKAMALEALRARGDQPGTPSACTTKKHESGQGA
ncbi:class I adenylate-forming enzyme family protein [Gloeobacter morelensis]